MRDYQFHFLTDEDRDVGREDHCCMNDRAAIRLGRTLCHYHNIDIWQNGRRVARVSTDEFGLNISNSGQSQKDNQPTS